MIEEFPISTLKKSDSDRGDSDTEVILPITPFEESTDKFFATPSLIPRLMIKDDILAETPFEITSAPIKFISSLFLKFKNSLYLIFSVS